MVGHETRNILEPIRSLTCRGRTVSVQLSRLAILCNDELPIQAKPALPNRRQPFTRGNPRRLS